MANQTPKQVLNKIVAEEVGDRDLSEPGALFDWLEVNRPAVSHLYPARIIPHRLHESVDALVTNTVKTGDLPEDHWIWEGKTNDFGLPVRYNKPISWYFYEIAVGYWHREAGLVRTCDELLCVKPDHHEVRMAK